MATFPRKDINNKKSLPAKTNTQSPQTDGNKGVIFQEAMKNRVQQAIDLLDVELDPNDPSLLEQLTLGDKWDDPFALTKAMDRQPEYYAKWATLLRKLKRNKQKIEAQYDVWVSIKKDEIYQEIFDENVTSGMTANNAKPTNQAVDNKFNITYVHFNKENPDNYKEYRKYKRPLEEIEEQIDTVEVVTKSFEQRKDMLISLSSLVRGMIDNQLLIYRNKKRQE